jgi:protein AroM
MSDTVLGIYTIGQTPRPDLATELRARFGAADVRLGGALDGLDATQIPPCRRDGYPLETRLHDGRRVVVDAAFLEPLLQALIDARDREVDAHLVLCAGAFPALSAGAPLVQPFEAAVARLQALDLRRLEVIVPFAAQEAPASHKWRAAGFVPQTHVLGARPAEQSLADWAGHRMGAAAADALIFDYVGFAAEVIAELEAAVGLPAFELGRLAYDRLEAILDAR